MGKNNKRKWTIAVLVAIALAVGGIIWDASTKSSEIEINKKEIAEVVEEIDTEIKPEQLKNSEHRIRFEERVQTMQTDIAAIETEQKTSFKAILDRLPENEP